jgi:hypothetical protein
MVQAQKMIATIFEFSLAMGKARKCMEVQRERFIQSYVDRALEALVCTPVAHVSWDEFLVAVATEHFKSVAAHLESSVLGAIETSTSLSLTLQVALAEMRAEYLEASDRCLGFMVEPPSMLTTSPTPASNTLTSTVRSTGPTRVPGRPYLHITFKGAFHG